MTLVFSQAWHSVCLFDSLSKFTCCLGLFARNLVIILLQIAGSRLYKWLAANTLVERGYVAWCDGSILHRCVLLLGLIDNVARNHSAQI